MTVWSSMARAITTRRGLARSGMAGPTRGVGAAGWHGRRGAVGVLGSASAGAWVGAGETTGAGVLAIVGSLLVVITDMGATVIGITRTTPRDIILLQAMALLPQDQGKCQAVRPPIPGKYPHLAPHSPLTADRKGCDRHTRGHPNRKNLQPNWPTANQCYN